VTLERPRYFKGGLITAEDLTQDQLYNREKARRHNRLLHGWGIVRGLELAGAGGSDVTVSPGYALDRRGEEIVVEDEVTLDLAGKPHGKPLFVVVRHDETLVRPVPIPGGQEFSRIRDGFCFEALAALPQSHEPWVILGDVVLGPRGRIAIGTEHRRLLV
jgi:hypothetical protein